jgi:hypothetical protein
MSLLVRPLTSPLRYLGWSLRQLYLLVFWPTKYNRDTELSLQVQGRSRFGRCLAYFLLMSPWILLIGCGLNFLSGFLFQLYLGPHLHFQWTNSWVGVALSLVLSVLLVGPVVAVVLNVAVGAALSVAFSALVGMTLGVPVGIAYGEPLDISVGTAFGVMLGTTLGVAMGIAVTAAAGVSAWMAAGVGGLLFGAIVGPVGGLAGGFRVGVATGASAGISFFLAFLLTYFRVLGYLVDVVLATVVYFAARWRPASALKLWRLHPLTWNEVIWLPLPFAGPMLSQLTRLDRKRALREIAFVAAQRPRHRAAAQDALIEVALDDLRAESVEEMAAVTERLQWTADPSLQLPARLTAALHNFDRTSQHAGQYLTLHSPYRQSHALDRAREDVERIQSQLIAAGGPTAARLLHAATEWDNLLRKEAEAFQSRVAGIIGIPNPFVVGSPVTEHQATVFAGRHDIVQQLEECMLGAHQALTILLHGPRRMGKTSILKQLPRLLGPDFAPALVDCQNPAITDSAAALLRYLTREISTGLRLRGYALEPLKAEQLQREPYATFDDWLDAVDLGIPHRLRVVLCLDEYENLQRIIDAGWGEAFLDALRHILQHRPKMVLIFIGAHTFSEQGAAWTRRFLSAQRVRVSFLTREEVIPLLTKPVPEFNMTYADGALDALVHATHGQPFLTQVVAFQLVELLNSQQRKMATPDDVEAAIDRALVRNSEYFESVWLEAGPEGQMVLRSVAHGQQVPAFSRACTLLREHDILTSNETFAVPMFERWVRQKTA